MIIMAQDLLSLIRHDSIKTPQGVITAVEDDGYDLLVTYDNGDETTFAYYDEVELT